MTAFMLNTIRQIKSLIIAVIPIGLAILATEFVWARSLLKEVKN